MQDCAARAGGVSREEGSCLGAREVTHMLSRAGALAQQQPKCSLPYQTCFQPLGIRLE